MASLYGWNPLEYLALEADDAHLVRLILEERMKLEEERTRGRLDHQASRTALLIVQPLTKWLGLNLPKMLRRKEK